MKKSKKAVADQLRKAIAQAERRGMTRYQIAKAAEISQTTMTRFYNGHGQLRLDIAERIADALGGKLKLDI